MSKRDDGGPAPSNENVVLPVPSLRDWFAGLSMQGMLAEHGRVVEDNGDNIPILTSAIFARLAYAQADAMLAERAKDDKPANWSADEILRREG